MPSLTAAAPTPEERQSVLRTLRHPRLLGIEVLAGLVVALALIPEAIAFSVIAGVDPRVGLFSAFTMAVTIAFIGGRPAMISAATGAVALVIAPVVASHGIHYLVAAILLAGVFQILLAVLGVAKLMRFIPRRSWSGSSTRWRSWSSSPSSRSWSTCRGWSTRWSPWRWPSSSGCRS